MRPGPAAAAAAGAVMAAVLAVAGCAARDPYAGQLHAQQLTVRPSASASRAGASATPTPSATPSAGSANGQTSAQIAVPGTAGVFRVGRHQFTFTEPAHAGPSGQALGPRTLITQLWYPAAPPAGSQPPHSGFPLLLFAPGFQLCADSYSDLLASWASAGYVVAAVNFPRTDCHVGAKAYEPDLINQPDDMMYVLKQLLALSQHPGDVVSGLINSHEVGAAGHSDGGDTVAALAANTCCTDHRIVAVAVLSGAEWPPMPGRYFAGSTPPMLFTQGSADTINPPWTSEQLYDSDPSADRYYLDLFGADHTEPYWGTNSVERVVARVTLAFFDRYVLGQQAALTAMSRAGDVEGAALVAGGTPVPGG